MDLTLSAAEFAAVREALAQYVENTEDALDIEPNEAARGICVAGAAVLDRLNIAAIDVAESTATKFVARIKGYSYEGGKETISECWLTSRGGATESIRDARVYASEAEAWEHLRATRNADPEDGARVEACAYTP